MKLGKECWGSGVGETVTRREGWMDVLVTSLLQNMLFPYTYFHSKNVVALDRKL
jgi:hypothetical protein